MHKKTKDFIRELLIWFKLDLTRNIKYDRLTRIIIRQSLKPEDKCVDIGCHKGEILNLFIKYAPKGVHYAFEPIPFLYDELKVKYKENALVFPFALAANSGESTFQIVKNALAYSGIKQRKYKLKNPEIEEVTVPLKTLDEVIPENEKIRLIKIDVEGGELGVLKGAKRVLRQNKPIVIFEFGKGASEFYNTYPTDVFHLLSVECHFKIYTLKSYIEKKKSTNFTEFEDLFNTGKEYYFVASTEDF